MNEYSICTNFVEIVAGTNNTITREYREAAKSIESDSTKGLGYLKNFITSIENIANKENVKDERITKSRGNIRNFVGYDNIRTAIQFLNKNLTGIPVIKDLCTIFNCLEANQSQYTDGYEKNVRLIILEYESAVYILVTGLSMVMANNMDVVQNGTQISIQKKSGSTYGIIPKTIKDMAKQMSNKNHKEYLEELVKGIDMVDIQTDTEVKKESTIMESSITDTFDLIHAIFTNTIRIGKYGKRAITTIRQSVFGIVPLIRSIMYLRYKRKADTVVALEQQVGFIQRNIEQLKNMQGMDPKKKETIIKKQIMMCNRYQKKAEKLRAQLTEGEKDAAVAIQKEDPQMKNTDDDFILEGVDLSAFYEAANAQQAKANRVAKAMQGKGEVHGVGPYGKGKLAAKHSAFGKQVILPAGLNAQKAADDAFDELMKKTGRDSIRLHLVDPVKTEEKKDRIKSKLGGYPYWPKDKADSFPKDKVLFAQLNFSDLPHLEGFPTKGLLQFYTTEKDIVGYADTTRFKIIYHETLVEEDQYLDEFGETTYDLNNIDYFPFTNMIKITGGTKERVCLQPSSDDFNDTFNEILSKHFKTEVTDMWDLPKEVYRSLVDKIYKNAWGTRIGGLPSFTQWDPRKPGQYDTLLFQVDSEHGIMWGDVGIGNFFIDPKDLSALKFDGTVLFNWDCY